LRREQPVCYEDHTDDTTHVIPVGNYVIVDLRNYVIGNPSNLGNYKIADTQLKEHERGLFAVAILNPPRARMG
jgi:hypothetical protein